MKINNPQNDTRKHLLMNMFMAFAALAVNGFGIYITIEANFGVAPWDVLSTGFSKTFGILYGDAAIMISVLLLVIDLVMKEHVGIGLIIDCITVSKTVDLLNYLDIFNTPESIFGKALMTVVGVTIIAFTQCFYMKAAIGCGPRDTLIVGIAKRIRSLPIGAITLIIYALVTFFGWLMGGTVGIGTIIGVVLNGPILQLTSKLFEFDIKSVTHQGIVESVHILSSKTENTKK